MIKYWYRALNRQLYGISLSMSAVVSDKIETITNKDQKHACGIDIFWSIQIWHKNCYKADHTTTQIIALYKSQYND